jgi:hypothetical protein
VDTDDTAWAFDADDADDADGANADGDDMDRMTLTQTLIPLSNLL